MTKSTNNSSEHNHTSWLFSFGASNVKAKATRKGHITFSFETDDCSMVTTFSDRPQRLTGTMKMDRLSKYFNKMFGDDKPNASVTYWDQDGNFNNHVYEIEGIKKRKGKYILRTDLIEDEITNSTASNASVIEQANFFVDNFWTDLGHDFEVGLGCFLGADNCPGSEPARTMSDTGEFIQQASEALRGL